MSMSLPSTTRGHHGWRSACRIWLCILMVFAAMSLHGQDDQTQPATTDPQPAETQPVESQPVPDYQGPTDEQPPPDWNRGDTMLEALTSLLLVLGLIVVLAFLAKKFLPRQLGGGGGGGNLKLVQTLPLGPNRFVSLIEADGKRFLLGVTEQQINLIKSMDDLTFTRELDQLESPAEAPKTVRELMEEET